MVRQEIYIYPNRRIPTVVYSRYTRCENEEIESSLPGLDVTTNLIDIAEQANICRDEDILPLGIQGFAFGDDAVGCFVFATDEIDTRPCSMLSELLEGCFANSTCCSDEESHHALRKGGSNPGIGGLDIGEDYHFVDIN